MQAKAKNSREKRAEPLRFEARLRLYSAALCLPILGLLTALLLIKHLSTTSIISILIVVVLALLLAVTTFIDQVIRPLQTLANVVAALREEDYSFRAAGARANDPFGDLAIEINALADMHQAQRLGSIEAAALFRRVIAELTLLYSHSIHPNACGWPTPLPSACLASTSRAISGAPPPNWISKCSSAITPTTPSTSTTSWHALPRAG